MKNLSTLKIQSTQLPISTRMPEIVKVTIPKRMTETVKMNIPKLPQSLINLLFGLLILLPPIFFALPSIFFFSFLILPCFCISVPPIILCYVTFTHIPIRPLARRLVTNFNPCATKFGYKGHDHDRDHNDHKLEVARKEQPVSYMVDRSEIPSWSESEDGEEDPWQDLVSKEQSKPFEDVMSFWKRKERKEI